MNRELDELLCQRYPRIFRDRHAPMTDTCMCWGLACNDGWYALIDTLCAEIQQHVDATGIPDVVASEVKEKFGCLRFYVRSGDIYVSAMTWFADYLSSSSARSVARQHCAQANVGSGRDAPRMGVRIFRSLVRATWRRMTSFPTPSAYRTTGERLGGVPMPSACRLRTLGAGDMWRQRWSTSSRTISDTTACRRSSLIASMNRKLFATGGLAATARAG